MKPFKVQSEILVEDGIGGSHREWITIKVVNAYIDMLSGSDLNTIQNAITEESTHILLIPLYTNAITDEMRIIGPDKRYYSITYSDNPMERDHHNEIYLKYGGVLDG